jgi:hypothetical protein
MNALLKREEEIKYRREDDSPAHSPQVTTEDMRLPDLKTG